MNLFCWGFIAGTVFANLWQLFVALTKPADRRR